MNSDRPFPCCKCSKAFKLCWHLKNHEKICMGEKTYLEKCDICDKQFTTKFSFKRHKSTCSKREEYPCNHCNEIFKTRLEHNVHMKKIHSKMECSFCENNVDIRNLRRHVANNHKGETPSITKLKRDQKEKKTIKSKHSCSECGKFYFDKSTLNRHMKNHQYPCPMCEKTFHKTNDLNCIHSSS